MSLQPRYNLEPFKALGQGATQVIREIITALRKNLTLHDNVNMLLVSYTSNATPDTEDSIDISSLGLSYVPLYMVVVEVTLTGAVVYPSNKGSWTSSAVTMKCSKASTGVTLGVI